MNFQSSPPRPLVSSFPKTINWGKHVTESDHSQLLWILLAEPDRVLRSARAVGLGLRDLKPLLRRVEPATAHRIRQRARQLGLRP